MVGGALPSNLATADGARLLNPFRNRLKPKHDGLGTFCYSIEFSVRPRRNDSSRSFNSAYERRIGACVGAGPVRPEQAESFGMNKKLLIGIAAAAIVAVGGIALTAKGGSGGKVGAYTYETAAVERGDVARIVSASGAVQPRQKTDVGSEVSGKILQLYADFNTVVKKDQVLAQIDPLSFINAVDQAKGRLLQSEATVANARNSIDRSEVALDIAKRTYDRQKALYAEQAISQAAWELADQQYKNALLQLDADKVSLKSAEAGLAQSKASLGDAELKLERTKIRSPIDGVVISRAVDVGQTVQSSMSVAKFFTIAEDLSQIQIEAAVVESDIGGIDEGDPVVFTVDAFPGERFQGVVQQVRKLGTESANVVTYTVVVAARNPNGKLLPGMTANVEITADRATNVLRIAYDATRFQPPKDVQEKLNAEAEAKGGAAPSGAGPSAASGSGQGGGQRGPGGPGGRGNPANEILKEIGIDDARVQKISAEMQGEIERMRASMPAQQGGSPLGGGGFGPPPGIAQQAAMQEMRQKMQQTTEAVMRRNLSQEEFDAYTKQRAQMQTQKRVPVYTIDDKGQLARETLTIGVSDGNFAEVIRGAKEGDKFVVRSVSTKAKKKS
jgi:HlyD family secretion protein